LRQCAVFLEHQKAPRQLDHAAAHAGITGPGQPLLSPPRTALVRRTGQTGPRVRPSAGPRTGSASDGLPVTQIARQDLVDEHVRGLDADADDPRQQPDHRMAGEFRVLLEPGQTRRLDFPDLVHDKAQPRHIPAQLGQCVRRQRRTFRSAQAVETFRRLAQGRFETPKAEPGPGCSSFD
jgi:hypothetical protein